MTDPMPWDEPTAQALPWETTAEPLEQPDDPLPDIEHSLALELAADVERAVVDYRDADAVLGFAQDTRAGVLSAVRRLYDWHLRARPEGRVVPSTVAPELSFLHDAAYALDALADAIKAGGDEARLIAGDVILDVKPDEKLGASTVKAGAVKATRTQASKVSADPEKIVDVLVSALVGQAASHGAGTDPVAYAHGARDALALLQTLVGPLAWKSTALDDLAGRLEANDDHALAIRLQHAYGRVATGKPKVKLERTDAAK